MSTAMRNTKVMNRFDLASRLVARLKNEEAVIGGIGNTNFDLWAAGRRPQLPENEVICAKGRPQQRTPGT